MKWVRTWCPRMIVEERMLEAEEWKIEMTQWCKRSSTTHASWEMAAYLLSWKDELIEGVDQCCCFHPLADVVPFKFRRLYSYSSSWQCTHAGGVSLDFLLSSVECRPAHFKHLRVGSSKSWCDRNLGISCSEQGPFFLRFFHSNSTIVQDKEKIFCHCLRSRTVAQALHKKRLVA